MQAELFRLNFARASPLLGLTVGVALPVKIHPPYSGWLAAVIRPKAAGRKISGFLKLAAENVGLVGLSERR